MGLSFNTPGTRGGPGGRDRTLAVKRRKNACKPPGLIMFIIEEGYAVVK